MNRYKSVALEIVKKWDEPGRRLVDSVLDIPRLDENRPIGLITVAGPPGSGKTILAAVIAQRLEMLGQAPAIIDYEADRGISCALDDFRLSTHRVIMELHHQIGVRGPVIITVTTNRSAVRHFRAGEEHWRIPHEACYLSELIWMTERGARNTFIARLKKCRRAVPGVTNFPIEIRAVQALNAAAEPYIAEGFRLAHNIRRTLGR